MPLKDMSDAKLFWMTLIVGAMIIALVIGLVSYVQNQEVSEDTLKQKIQEQKKRWEESDNYNDGCKKNAECSECKRNIACLSCMHDCYNRHGDASNRQNPFQDKAIECYTICWEQDFGASPDIDFEIEMNRKK